jgi:acyl-CoA thioesterase FadM
MLYNFVVSKFTRVVGLFLLTCLLLAFSRGTVAAQEGSTTRYFADTGHTVSGDFWTYYQGLSNAALVVGSPITEAFSDAKTGRLIQYFQRARFEYFPENPVGQRVKLTSLGEFVYQRMPVGATLNFFAPIGCRYYADTGFSICYAFLEFFDKNGGEAVFGKPRSPFVVYNGRIVQYFERARFEWYPEYPEGQKVVLAELGRIYFDLVPEDANLLQAVKIGENAPGNVLQLNTRAFTWKAVTQMSDQQAVYAVVQDQTLRPVPGATVIVTTFWPVGGVQREAQTTNQYGVAIIPLKVQGQPYGSVVTVQVEVIYQGLTSQTVTSFRIWQ